MWYYQGEIDRDVWKLFPREVLRVMRLSGSPERRSVYLRDLMWADFFLRNLHCFSDVEFKIPHIMRPECPRATLGQIVEGLKELSGKSCLRKVLRVITLS